MCRPCGAFARFDDVIRGLTPPATICRRFAAERLRRDAQGVFRLGDDGVEGGGVADGQFRERLAVEFDLGLFQTGDELAVPQAALAAGRVDADDPQLAELAFADPAVPVGKRLGADERLLDRAIKPAASAGVALRPLKEPILLAPSCGADGGSHRRNPSLRSARPGLRSDIELVERKLFGARRACSGC